VWIRAATAIIAIVQVQYKRLLTDENAANCHAITQARRENAAQPATRDLEVGRPDGMALPRGLDLSLAREIRC
jgi:hypothetical protein